MTEPAASPEPSLTGPFGLEPILWPHLGEQRRAMIAQGGRFVHYTSAANGIAILQGRQLWMRDTRCMNDYREVQHGREALQSYFAEKSETRARFEAALDGCAAGLFDSSVTRFDHWWPHVAHSVYIASISEHDDSEDRHGRLSMWRAYGRDVPSVAIVMRLPLETPINDLGVWFTPVLYADRQQLASYLDRIAQNIALHREALAGLGHEGLTWRIHIALLLVALATKHPGFHEEREWRVIHVPSLAPRNRLLRAVETVGGVPQPVYKIPLANVPDTDIQGIAPAQLIDRIIIGPSLFPGPIWDAYVGALEDAEVPDPRMKVVLSDIPLRT